MKCNRCCADKPEEEFAPRDTEKYRTGSRRHTCKGCQKEIQRRRYAKHKKNSYFKYKTSRARSRAQSLGVPFNLTEEYLEELWTGTCPVTGITLKKNADRSDEAAAELDRFIPELGYTIGNVSFLSRKINRIKNNCSIEELEKLVSWMKSR